MGSLCLVGRLAVLHVGFPLEHQAVALAVGALVVDEDVEVEDVVVTMAAHGVEDGEGEAVAAVPGLDVDIGDRMKRAKTITTMDVAVVVGEESDIMMSRVTGVDPIPHRVARQVCLRAPSPPSGRYQTTTSCGIPNSPSQDNTS